MRRDRGQKLADRHAYRLAAVAALALVAGTALVLFALGRTPICTCGTVRLWHGAVFSPENSQQLSDWYTFSHVIHGFLFYGAGRLINRAAGGRIRAGTLVLAAIAVECGWEILENSPVIIDRYRAETISLDYYGDSIVNSVSDVLTMIVGYLAAARLPVAVTVGLAVFFELLTGYLIRDNLTLNVLMLIWPLDAVRDWQAGAQPAAAAMVPAAAMAFRRRAPRRPASGRLRNAIPPGR